MALTPRGCQGCHAHLARALALSPCQRSRIEAGAPETTDSQLPWPHTHPVTSSRVASPPPPPQDAAAPGPALHTEATHIGPLCSRAPLAKSGVQPTLGQAEPKGRGQDKETSHWRQLKNGPRSTGQVAGSFLFAGTLGGAGGTEGKRGPEADPAQTEFSSPGEGVGTAEGTGGG